MEEIVEIFADAISGFLLLSINLQEKNAMPPSDLREHGSAVSTTSLAVVNVARFLHHTVSLLTLSRELADSEYYALPETYQQVQDAASRLEQATSVVSQAVQELFTTGDRASKWKNLVNGTKCIGQESCRLLVIVYGANQKRLEQACHAAIASCLALKKYGFQTAENLNKVALTFSFFQTHKYSYTQAIKHRHTQRVRGIQGVRQRHRCFSRQLSRSVCVLLFLRLFALKQSCLYIHALSIYICCRLLMI